jgi:hypothetical protein
MSMARESRFYDGGLTFAAESASSAASHKQMARSRATLADIWVETGPCPLKINVKRESMLRCPDFVQGNRAPWAIPRSRAVRFATARASNLAKPHFSRDLSEMLDPSGARA